MKKPGPPSAADYARIIAAERVMCDALRKLADMVCAEHGEAPGPTAWCEADGCGVWVAAAALRDAYPESAPRRAAR